MRSGAAETANQMRTHICKAVIGRSYKGAEGARWQTGAAHVRCTMYDLEIWRAFGSRKTVGGCETSHPQGYITVYAHQKPWQQQSS